MRECGTSAFSSGALASGGRGGNAVERCRRAWHLWGDAALRRDSAQTGAAVPSLIRLLVVLGVLGGIGYGAMWWLANKVEPGTRTISVTVPNDRFAK